MVELTHERLWQICQRKPGDYEPYWNTGRECNRLVSTVIKQQATRQYSSDYWSFAYSALASFRMGMSGSASLRWLQRDTRLLVRQCSVKDRVFYSAVSGYDARRH